MDVSFQLLLYILKVIYQEDQQFCILNVCDVMWKAAIVLSYNFTRATYFNCIYIIIIIIITIIISHL